MKKIGLLICGNSGIDYVNIGYPLEVIRARLIINDKEYEDFVDIKAETFYSMLENNPDLKTTTAQPSTGEIVSKIEKLRDAGYEEIISVIISSKLAGNYNHVKFASEMVSGVKVHVIDSRSVSFGQTILVLRAVELIKKGWTAEEIVKDIEEYKTRIQIFVLVKDIKYLIRSGRLSIAKGVVGILLKIKPILSFNEEGELVPTERIRTYKKAKERLLELAQQEIDDDCEIFALGYTNNKEEVEEIKAEILKNNPNLKIELYPLTPVVGSHAGPGTSGFGVVRKKKETLA